jgi:alkanesulfonate monooxygenase SsuD/methylene tetrahydromethanopterin reductase-like flavin-dependent oxidoreductase (luciferase family)
MDATNANMKQRGAMADEFLHVLKAIWTTNPVKYEGKFFRVPESYINQKPVQKPHPPVYLAAFAPPALKRLATMADGWNPVAIPIPGMTQMFWAVQQMAKEAGRDPSSRRCGAANLQITDQRLGADRGIFAGTLDQIREDAQACARIGAHELIYDVTFEKQARTSEGWLHLMETLRKMV